MNRKQLNETSSTASLIGISSTTLRYLNPTSSIQTHINGNQPTVNSGTDLALNSVNGISSTTLSYLNPTSSIQTHINGNQPTVTSGTDLALNSLKGISSTT